MKTLRLLSCLLALAFATPFVTHCTAVQYVTDDAQRRRGYLRLEVEPDRAMVLVDGDYRGEIRGWRGGVVPVVAGDRKVELRADGYITQRFDVRVGAGEEVTLRLQMEPVLITVDEPDQGEEPARRPRLR